MKNDKNQDKLFINKIQQHTQIENASKQAVGNAGKDSFCIYDHQRHAPGSKIENLDGSIVECTEDGSWQNSKK